VYFDRRRFGKETAASYTLSPRLILENWIGRNECSNKQIKAFTPVIPNAFYSSPILRGYKHPIGFEIATIAERTELNVY
jgi:hypothetical protein